MTCELICALCHHPVDLFELDATGYEGLPAHARCAEPARAEVAEVLRQVEDMVRAEANPRRHRSGARRAA